MRYITAELNQGRLGHQMRDQISARIAAKLFGLKYVHYLLCNNSKPWEDFLGFGEGEVKYDDIINKNLKIVEISDTPPCPHIPIKKVEDIVKENNQDNTFFIFKNSTWINESSDNFLQLKKEVFNELKDKYFSKREINPIKDYFNKEKVNIAVQIRRGGKWKDVNKRINSYLYVENKSFINLIHNLNKILNPKKVDIHIYSEGPEKELPNFSQFSNVFLHICDNKYPELYNTFHQMLMSDILVALNSCFTIFLGNLTQNFVIFHKKSYNLNKSNTSIVWDDDGNLEQERLKDYITNKFDYTYLNGENISKLISRIENIKSSLTRI
ncbi:MAG: hypothetical protein KJ674_05505 [Nanoarchaeota archaeon]|nr:hypothetical protein [Nanoarchaeota archaeon]